MKLNSLPMMGGRIPHLPLQCSLCLDQPSTPCKETPDVIGKTLGHYEILAEIGHGGMGVVYRARDTRLGRDVALKILPSSAAADPERIQRFEREAKAVASLQHPSIVTIHSIEKSDGTQFLTMELVSGNTLDELIPSDGLPLDRLFEIGTPLAKAVHAAHERGVIHRDLKPGNVMIDASGHLKVLDFGLAKLVSIAGDHDQETITMGDATQEGHVLGTVAYMSPEQAEGKELDRRSDIFSLGVVLYEAATGKRPFTGDTPISTMSALLRDAPPPVTSLKPLPRHLGRIVHRCLQKDPDRRFQTARDVANELEGLEQEVKSGELESITTGTALPVTRPKARPKWPWLVAAAAAITAIVAWLVTSDRPAPTGTSLVTRRLTSHAAPEWAGSWSPDGSFFAFVRCTHGPQDVFVGSTSGGDPICLVESSADDYIPRWSPDNRWIAFASNRGGTADLYVVPPLGGPIRKLVSTGVEGLGDESWYTMGMQPWSPDGRRLVFARMRDNRTALWVLEIDSGEETELTDPSPGESDGQASWSFDGETIAFVRAAGNVGTVCTVSATGGAVRDIHDTGVLATPSWTRDGKRLLFVTDVGGTSNLWSVDISSGEAEQLTAGSTDAGEPAMSPDGSILYSDFSHQTDLYLQRLDGSESRRLTFHTETNFGARLSPTGDRVVYDSDRTGHEDVWLLEIESGAERRLTDHAASDRGADWSPDGSRIVFVSERSGRAQLWTMSPEGGTPIQITDQEGVSGSPRWAPDGSGIGYIATTDEGAAAWRVDADGRNPRPIWPHVMEFDWYRDSRHLIYTPRGSPTEVRWLDLETREEDVLADEPHIEVTTARDGSALTFCAATSHFDMGVRLARLEPSSTGPPRVVETAIIAEGKGLWHAHNGGVDPTGEVVVFTRDTDTGDVYVLEGAF